jgi:hypothetical protein
MEKGIVEKFSLPNLNKPRTGKYVLTKKGKELIESFISEQEEE